MRYAIVETRIYEVEAVDEAAALAQLEEPPDRTPVYHTTVVEPLIRARLDTPRLQVAK